MGTINVLRLGEALLSSDGQDTADASAGCLSTARIVCEVREEQRQAKKEGQRRYREKNRERIAEYSRSYRKNTAEAIRQQQKNSVARKATHKRSHAVRGMNPERQEHMRQYKQANRVEIAKKE